MTDGTNDRRARLDRIKATMLRYYNRHPTAQEEARFMETGTFCPDRPAPKPVFGKRKPRPLKRHR